MTQNIISAPENELKVCTALIVKKTMASTLSVFQFLFDTFKNTRFCGDIRKSNDIKVRFII